MAKITGIEGQRLYIQTSYGEACVASLKKLGAKWDADRKQWWIGRAKEAQVKEIVAGAPATKQDLAAQVGLVESTPAGVVADKLDDEGRNAEATALRESKPPQEDPATIRLVGKARYKGRSYYVRAITHDQRRCRRLLRLSPDDGRRDRRTVSLLHRP